MNKAALQRPECVVVAVEVAEMKLLVICWGAWVPRGLCVVEEEKAFFGGRTSVERVGRVGARGDGFVIGHEVTEVGERE